MSLVIVDVQLQRSLETIAPDLVRAFQTPLAKMMTIALENGYKATFKPGLVNSHGLWAHLRAEPGVWTRENLRTRKPASFNKF